MGAKGKVFKETSAKNSKNRLTRKVTYRNGASRRFGSSLFWSSDFSDFLPLSKNAELLKGLGTRHRAALGLSEISDAVVIVVSEETGLKSIFYRSKMYQVKNQEIMRNKLREFLADEREIKLEERTL